MNNSGAQRKELQNGHFRLSALPGEISQAIERFYEKPIKLDITLSKK